MSTITGSDGDTTGVGAAVPTAPVVNASLETMPANTVKGSLTGSGAPVDLTAVQFTSIVNLATTSLQGAMAATDKVKLNELSPTLSTTIVGTDATSISVDVSAYGDGLYEVEFVGTGHTSSGPELLWQANGAGLTSPNGVYLQAPAGVLSDNVETVGMFFNNIFVNNADTTLRVWGTFSSRNNKLSGYDSTGFGKAGATVGSVMIGGYHTPAAVLTSIGLLATNFDATDRIKVGSVLRVRKIGS